MRRVKAPPCPLQLDPGDPESPGSVETAAAIEHYCGNGKAPEPFAFNAFKHLDVRLSLLDGFNRTCAYCEARTPSIEIEHYRPKGAIRTEDDYTKPGYYWMAASWENLLPSCHPCNTVLETEYPDGERRKSGKGNWFPLEDEAMRATKRGEERDEKPLLLHPYFDNPEEHIEYTADGAMKARTSPDGVPSRRGEKTIEILGLNRLGLPEARKERRKLLQATLKSVLDAQRLWQQDPTNKRLAGEHEARVEELTELLEPGAGFAGMVAQDLDLG